MTKYNNKTTYPNFVMKKYKYTNKIVEVKIDYVYISCDIMINLYSEIREKDFDVHLGWIFDLIDQIAWSLGILKKYNHKYYKELQNKYKKIGEKIVDKLISEDKEKEKNDRPNKMGNTPSAIRK